MKTIISFLQKIYVFGFFNFHLKNKTNKEVLGILIKDPEILGYGVAKLIFNTTSLSPYPCYYEEDKNLFSLCLFYVNDKKFLKEKGDIFFELMRENYHQEQDDYVFSLLNLYRKCEDLDGIKKCANWIYCFIDNSYPVGLYLRMNLFIEAKEYDLIQRIAQESRTWCGHEYDHFANYYEELIYDFTS